MKIEDIQIGDLKFEEGMMEAVNAPSMKPYQDFIRAMILREPVAVSKAWGEIQSLPMKEKYIWRVASALKLAFIDFDSISVDVDRRTMTDEQKAEVSELLKNRLLQCGFLMDAWFGNGTATAMLNGVMEVLKQEAGNNEGTKRQSDNPPTES